MAHKYLKEAGFDRDFWADTLPKNDDRRPEWAKQRREYSMDERETWSLGNLSLTWLYEHIKMYLDFSDIDYVDLNWHKFIYNDVEYDQKQILNKILHDIELYFNLNDCFFLERFGKTEIELAHEDRGIEKIITHNREQPNFRKEIFDLWAVVLPQMWW